LAAFVPSLSAAAASKAAPDFPVDAPSPPGALSAEFSLEAGGDRNGKPTAMLSWQPSMAQTYLIKGYRVLLRDESGNFKDPSAGQASLLPSSFTTQSVEVGKVYAFAVQAVDAKGNSSAASAPAILDLVHLDPSRLAPRAPQGLTATSMRNAVRLSWNAPQAWYAPVSTYILFRDKEALAKDLSLTTYMDLSPKAKTLFTYQVEAVDVSGRASVLSLTATGQATGAVAPLAPKNLSISAKAERVVLSWEPSLAGTAPVSFYLIKRITEPGAGESGEVSKKLAPLDMSRTSYTDSVEGSHFYRYELRSIDSEGNTSAASEVRAFVESKPFNKTELLLMPTAYSNNLDRDTGLNINVLFDYFVGSLFYNYFSQTADKASAGVFQPLQVGTVSLDLKETWIPETRFSPALATGFYGTALINFGAPNSAQTVGVSSSGGGIQSLGDLYAVASKRFGYQSAIHLGFMHGGLADELVGLADKSGHPDWDLTIRHLMPGGDYPKLLDHMVEPSLSVQVQDSPDMLFSGIQFPFSLPLGFTRWRSALKLEVLAPLNPEPLRRQAGVTDVSGPPLMFNFHFDNLPLFGFEFSIFEFQNGWEWIAFYHIPDLTWSW
jgi:hypothetical protein